MGVKKWMKKTQAALFISDLKYMCDNVEMHWGNRLKVERHEVVYEVEVREK